MAEQPTIPSNVGETENQGTAVNASSVAPDPAAVEAQRRGLSLTAFTAPPSPVIYFYEGGGAAIPDVPARDLTQADVDALKPGLLEVVQNSHALYRKAGV